jgi:hypothetical protein
MKQGELRKIMAKMDPYKYQAPRAALWKRLAADLWASTGERAMYFFDWVLIDWLGSVSEICAGWVEGLNRRVGGAFFYLVSPEAWREYREALHGWLDRREVERMMRRQLPGWRRCVECDTWHPPQQMYTERRCADCAMGPGWEEAASRWREVLGGQGWGRQNGESGEPTRRLE